MQLDKLRVRFMGPYSAQLFKVAYVEEPGFDTTVIGTGESKAVAAARALSHLAGQGYATIMNQIEDGVQRNLPERATAIEAPELNINVYAVISLSAKGE